MVSKNSVITFDGCQVVRSIEGKSVFYKIRCDDWDISSIAETFVQIFFEVFNHFESIDRTVGRNELNVIREIYEKKIMLYGHRFFKMKLWGLEPCIVLDINGEIICAMDPEPVIGFRGIKNVTEISKKRLGRNCRKVSDKILGTHIIELDTSSEANFWSSDYFPYWFAFKFSKKEFILKKKKKLIPAKVINCKKSISEIRDLWKNSKEIFYQKQPPWDGYGVWGSLRESKLSVCISYEFLDFCDEFLDHKDMMYAFDHRIFPRGLFPAFEK